MKTQKMTAHRMTPTRPSAPVAFCSTGIPPCYDGSAPVSQIVVRSSTFQLLTADRETRREGIDHARVCAMRPCQRLRETCGSGGPVPAANDTLAAADTVDQPAASRAGIVRPGG